MKKRGNAWYRWVSMLLVFALALPLACPALAGEADAAPEEGTYLDFSAGDYSAGEGDGIFHVTIQRNGGDLRPVHVVVRVADILSEYGVDYELLDDNGDPVPRLEGIHMEPSELVAENDYDFDAPQEPEDAAAPSAPPAEEADGAWMDEAEAALRSTGSPLHDAQNAYLGLTAPGDEARVRDEISTVLDSLSDYLAQAQGTQYIAALGQGETRKDLTIRVLDNDGANAQRIFLLALMATDVEGIDTAANATAYVTITDDEPTETPVYTLSGSGVTLSREAPEAEVTVTRTAGLAYFGTVYVSTVADTADETHYETFTQAKISFLPGQDRVTFPVRACDFSQGGAFGVRLETDGAGEVEQYYLPVTIHPDAGGPEQDVPAPAALLEVRNADGIIGQAETAVSLDSLGTGRGPTLGKQDGSYYTEWNRDKRWSDHCVYETYKWSGRSIVTANPVDLTGMKQIKFMWANFGDHGGRWGCFLSFFDVVDSASNRDRWGNGVKACFTWDAWNGHSGYQNWRQDSVDVSSLWNNYYLRAGSENYSRSNEDSWASDNLRFKWGNPLTYVWRKYTFNSASSGQRFYIRDLYDYYTGDGAGGCKITHTENLYDPGTVYFVDRDGSRVNGFYPNAGRRIYIRQEKESENAANGIYLKGYYIYADGGKPLYYNASDSVYVDQNELARMIRNGAVGESGGDMTLYVKPDWGQETVRVKFFNADTINGKFDETHLGTYVTNVMKYKHDRGNGRDYYYTDLPKHAAIRLEMAVAKGQVANGFSLVQGGRTTTAYEKGYHDPNTGLDVPEHKERLTHTLSQDLEVHPMSGKQTFRVSYHPANRIPEGINLSECIMDVGAVNAGEQEQEAIFPDATGTLMLKNVYTGGEFSLRAMPPEGYYTVWVNRTGDLDGNGYIDTDRESIVPTSNAPTVTGDVLMGTVDQPNPIYYYYFVPITSTASDHYKNGWVVKEQKTIYEMIHGIANERTTPVPMAGVTVAGFSGAANSEGYYKIDLDNSVPTDGDTIVSVDSEGKRYYSGERLWATSTMKLPAIDPAFTPVSMSAGYLKNAAAGDVTGRFIGIKNADLEIRLRVRGNGTLNPALARFVIYDYQGNSRNVVMAAPGQGATATFPHSVTNQVSGAQLDATLVFNPSAVCNNGDQIYIQLGIPLPGDDKKIQWYPATNLGYAMSKDLDMQTFVLGAIGSTTLEAVVTHDAVVDVLGSPLSKMDFGSTFGMTKDRYDTEDGRIGSSYSFGWDTTLGGKKKYDSKKEYKKELKEYQKKLDQGEAVGEKPAAPNFTTNNNFSWSVSPSVAFQLNVSSLGEKYYFENLSFLAKAGFNVSNSTTITLPIGIGIVIEAALSGEVTGVYVMYTDYNVLRDNTVEFKPGEFGLFKSMPDVRRAGYIFMDPAIEIGLGVEVAIVKVVGHCKFSFDMDFAFEGTAGGGVNTRAYGTVKISGDIAVKVLTFTVYKKNLGSTGELKLFNSSGQNGHIELNDILPDHTTRIDLSQVDDPGAAAFRANRSPALRGGGDAASVQELLSGAKDPSAQIVKLDDTQLLMVFVGERPDRDAVNARAVCWSLYDGTAWSEPRVIADDGTLDDYPSVCDLGDELLVTWSSADVNWTDAAAAAGRGPDLEDALQAMNIQAAFFDKAGKTFGETLDVTKTTQEDRCADVFPYAAYDKDGTGKLLLVYTKNEYDFGAEPTFQDLGGAYSALAYLFAEKDPATGAWRFNDGEDYTPEELAGIGDAAAQQAYKENWYGQRFLDVQCYTGDPANPQTAVVADMSMIYYNGLALVSFIPDWDGDLNTMDDRDVFLLIYNFRDNEFHYNMRVTKETGTYTNPSFGRSDAGNTYLFYGQADTQQVTDPADGATAASDPDGGSIRALNVSDPIRNASYRLMGEPGDLNRYYTFWSEIQSAGEWVSSDGVSRTWDAVYAQVEAAEVAKASNINDFDVFVDNDGRIYLLWTGLVRNEETQTADHQVFVAMYAESDAAEAEKPEEDAPEGTGQDADAAGAIRGSDRVSVWSRPRALTGGSGVDHGGLSGTFLNGQLLVAAVRSDRETGESSLVLLRHTPATQTALSDALTLGADYPAAGSTTTLTAQVLNNGLLPSQDAQSVEFFLRQGGAETSLGRVTAPAGITGNDAQEVTVSFTVPDDPAGAAVYAKLGDQVTRELPLPYAPAIEVGYEEIVAALDEQTDRAVLTYAAQLTNVGNKDYEALEVTVTCGEEQVGHGVLAAGEDVRVPLRIPDGAFTVDSETGDATAQVAVRMRADGAEVYTATLSAARYFDPVAMELLQNAHVAAQAAATVTVGETKALSPEITGPSAQEVRVLWQESSDPDVLRINGDNSLTGLDSGEVTLTGSLVPLGDRVSAATEAGRSSVDDWADVLPEALMGPVTMTVTVKSAGSHSGGHVSNQTKDPDGAVTTTKTKLDGSTVSTTRTSSGSVAETTTGTDGVSSTQITLKQADIAPDGTAAISMRPIRVTDRPATAPSVRVKTPDGGTTVVSIPTTNATVSTVAAAVAEDGTLTILPETRYHGGAITFPAESGVTYKLLENGTSFEDIAEDSWYSAAVAYASARGLVKGTSETMFQPQMDTSRAMMATILYRLAAGEPPQEGVTFRDVIAGEWYADAVAWANQKGIVKGYSAAAFGTNDPITREQLAVMLYRYAGSPAVQGDLEGFADRDMVSDFAAQALVWATRNQIVKGVGGDMLAPKAKASRAEVVQMLMNYLEQEQERP